MFKPYCRSDGYLRQVDGIRYPCCLTPFGVCDRTSWYGFCFDAKQAPTLSFPNLSTLSPMESFEDRNMLKSFCGKDVRNGFFSLAYPFLSRLKRTVLYSVKSRINWKNTGREAGRRLFFFIFVFSKPSRLLLIFVLREARVLARFIVPTKSRTRSMDQ